MTREPPPLWLFRAPIRVVDEASFGLLDRACFAVSRFYGGWRILNRRDLRVLGEIPFGTDVAAEYGIRFRRGEKVRVKWTAPE